MATLCRHAIRDARGGAVTVVTCGKLSVGNRRKPPEIPCPEIWTLYLASVGEGQMTVALRHDGPLDSRIESRRDCRRHLADRRHHVSRKPTYPAPRYGALRSSWVKHLHPLDSASLFFWRIRGDSDRPAASFYSLETAPAGRGWRLRSGTGDGNLPKIRKIALRFFK